ncbi:MAG: TonB-dependent receptor [Vicinamibacterales bacterium]
MLVLLLHVLLVRASAAEGPAGVVAGTVTDASGAVVPRAAVDLIGSGLARATVSDATGQFAFADVRPGAYRLIVTVPGFAPSQRDPVAVGPGETVDASVTLEVGHAEAAVVITASSTPQGVQDVQASAEIVTAEDLRAYPGNNVTEALKLVSGVDARSSGANASVSIRGFSASGGAAVLLLSDGLRRTGKYGATNLNLLELESVDRVEVVRGPMSALYGADATGGVVNVISRPIRRSSTPTGSARIQAGGMSGGQRATLVEGASIEFGARATGHRVSVEQRNRGLFRFDPSTAGAADLSRIDETFVGYQGDASLPGFRSLRWDAEVVNQDDTGPGLLAASPPARPAPEPYRIREQEQRYFGALHFAGVAGPGALQIDAAFGRSAGETTRSYPAIERTRFGQLQAQARYYLRARAHAVVLGSGLLRDAISISNFLSTSPVRTNPSLFAQDEWRLGAGVSLLAGVRADRFTDFGQVVTPRGSLLLKRGHWSLRGGYGQAFRAPSVTEQYSSFLRGRFLITGNPDLVPERNRTWEVAAAWRRQSFDAEVTWFDSRVDNLIQSISQPRQPQDPSSVSLRSVYANVAAARLRGVEAASTWRATSWLVVTGGWDYLDAVDRTTGARLTGRARANARGALRVERGRWRIDLRGRQYIGFYAADPNTRTGPAFETNYGTADMKVELKLTPMLSVSGGVDNVRNRRQPVNFSSTGAILEPPARYGYVGARLGF